jgi:hypothetical protein
MSFESHGVESPRLMDKSKHRQKHRKEREYIEKSSYKPTGSPFLSEEKKKPPIEVLEESPSVTGGLSGLKPEALPKGTSSGKSFFSGWQRPAEKPSTRGGHGRPVETMQESRIASTARELKDVAWSKALELRDTSLQYANQLRDTVQDVWGGKAGVSVWERYGKKKKQALRLHEQAEQKMREARSAPPDRSHDLYLEAQVLKQRALKKAVKAQSLAQQMLRKIDEKVNEYERVTPSGGEKMTAWELYGKSKSKANALYSRALVKEHEARTTNDYRRGAELLEEAGRLKARALRKAEEARAYAEGIKKAADDKVMEMRRWAESESSSSGGAQY